MSSLDNRHASRGLCPRRNSQASQFGVGRPGRRGWAQLLGLCLFIVFLALPLSGQAQTTISTYADSLGEPKAVTTNASGDVIVGTPGRIYLIRRSQAPVVIAGDGVVGYSGDGGPAVSARVGDVSDLALDASGNLYFADTSANRIRRIGTDGVISTVAGNGSAVHSGDGGPATEAGLQAPTHLALNSSGQIFVSTGHRIRRFERGGNIITHAGTDVAGYSGDGGPATSAQFNTPAGLAIDSGDRLFVADKGNHVVRIVAQDADFNDMVYWYAGNGGDDYDGSATLASQVGLGEITGLHLVSQDQLYVSHPASHRVFLIYSNSISVVAGNGTQGAAGDEAWPQGAQLNSPMDVATHRSDIYVADSGNGKIRRVGLVPMKPPVPLAEAGDAQARVTVVPWVDPDGFVPSGYEVRSYPEGGIDTGTGTALERAVTGLVNRTEYQFAVRAVYGKSYSPWSDYSAVVMPDVAGRPSLTDAVLPEGDAGTSQMVFTATLSRTVDFDARFGARTVPGTAGAGDYTTILLTTFVIPAGQTSVNIPVTIQGDTTPEPGEWFKLEVTSVDGSEVYAEAVGTIVNDDTELVPFGGRDDRIMHAENGGELPLLVLENDVFAEGVLVGGSLSIVANPQHGVASASDNGSPGDASDDFIVYRPPVDWSGEDSLRYRVCDSLARCYESAATVDVSLTYLQGGGQFGYTGRVINRTSGQRDLPSVLFEATPLIEAQSEIVDLAVDPTPISPWDYSGIGSTVRFRNLPESADGAPVRWRVQIWAGGYHGSGEDLYVGIDDNGDGLASANELRCVSAMKADSEHCELSIDDPGTGTPSYWVLVHNTLTRADSVDVHIMEVPLVATDGTLVSTGPGNARGGEAFDLWTSWDMPHLLRGVVSSGIAGGYIRILSGSRDELDLVPVLVSAWGGPNGTPKLLQSGDPYDFGLAPGEAQERMFIDVPAGASSLTVTTTANGNIDLYLAHAATPSSPTIAVAPVRANAQASSLAADGNETLTLSGSQLLQGRWYVTPVNREDADVHATVTATITGVAPLVRSGSYFNAARSGHGLFIYPAADQWVGIWYTYLPNSTPTWYYLQGTAPGVNGIWTGTLYRSAWLGTGNVLTPIGRGTVTPTGPDAFVFTHEVAGVTGSEPMAALGRGCPSIGSTQQDASSHWFDPAHAGVGYSVQMFPNYEFYTAFVYDAQGIARFLLGERNGFGGAQATLDLEQVTGLCPTCSSGDRTRSVVGVLNRTFANGTLSAISVDAIYSGAVPGAWTGSDIVQPLGGPGTTQGCGF